MRVSSIRGQLRWWSRLLLGPGAPEYQLFGGIAGDHYGYDEKAVASRFRFAIQVLPGNPESSDEYLVPHKRPQPGFLSKSLPEGSRYTLIWSHQAHPEFVGKPDDQVAGQTRVEQLERVIKTWLLLGTIGRRATRAMGSVWPLGFQPTVDQFNAIIFSLDLPAEVWVSVLNVAEPSPSQTDLTLIAGKTVHGLKFYRIFNDGTYQGVHGNPFGFVDGKDRKASALRFKVGHFIDGYRLIAIWDNRNSRGGNKSAALDALRIHGNGEQLAGWLDAAGFLTGRIPAPDHLSDSSDPVVALLAQPFKFPSIQRYRDQVRVWQTEKKVDFISRFVELTKEPKYGGLREQPWYPKPPL